MALRVSSEATCIDDLNFLNHVLDDPHPELLPRLPPWRLYPVDSGMDPYVWTVCSDLLVSGRIPSLESLETVDLAIVSSIEVISVDRHSDPLLQELHRILNVSSSCITTDKVVDQLAKLVCNVMGHRALLFEVCCDTCR